MKYLTIVLVVSLLSVVACKPISEEEVEKGLRSPCVSAADVIKSGDSANPCGPRRLINRSQS
ncbi:MAG: hypothetical protein K0R63_1238 [Rickettsiales bacterium]|jgi:hypothetical protein|nr:hypothetical protein [Rickettsiales bacterium]